MSPRSLIKYALLAFVAISLFYWGYTEIEGRTETSAKIDVSPADEPAAEKRVIAYYFHGNIRCAQCIDIEIFSGEAINQSFPRELEKGLLEYRVVNIQEPENQHFFEDYNLSSWSLVLVEYRSGRQVRWKNLNKVWELVTGDTDTFHDYVKTEVMNFLSEERGA